MSMRKLRKLLRSPGIFLRDHLNVRYPQLLNEVACPETLEPAVIEQGLALEAALDVTFPIDVVYTWVDGSDPAWRARYAAHVTPVGGTVATALEGAGTDEARFRSHDELTYSVRSVLTHLPWVRRIFIVTDRQQPLGLPADARIQVIDHRELMDERFLPTFNSHVIEAHLHRIPGLAEHFIYFNDDVLVARALPAGHFFQPNGLASLFVSSKSLAAMRSAGRSTPTLLASTHSARLLRQTHGVDIDRPLVHTYMPLRRSTYERVWSCYGAPIEDFLGNRTRGAEDLNLATFLVPWSAYWAGDATLKTDICHYFNVRSAAAPARYRLLQRRSAASEAPHSMCLNDFQADSRGEPGYEIRLSRFLRHYFAVGP